jgi:hypothetical protein
MNGCLDDGYVVNEKMIVPDDASEYYYPNRAEVVGCNRLKCHQCGEWVRNTADANGRHYACRCQKHDVYNFESVRDGDRYPVPVMNGWACDGHPPPSLPLDFGGVSFSDGTDVERVVREHVSVPGDAFPGLWLERAFGHLRGTAVGDRLLAAVRALASSADATEKKAAEMFFKLYPTLRR